MEIEKNYDSLRNLFIKDQLMAGVPKELRLFLKENGTISLNECISLGDNLAAARESSHRSFNKPVEPARHQRDHQLTSFIELSSASPTSITI